MTEDSRKRVREDYSLGGARYDSIRIESPRGQLLSRHDLGLFARLLPAETGLRALEVGAGTGRFTFPLLERGHEVVATDINEAQLSALRAKLRERNLEERCRVQVDDIFGLSFADASFDLVVCIHVVPRFLTWEDQRAALLELGRVVRPGGRLLVNYRNRRSPYNLVYKGPAIKPAQFESALAENDLHVVAERTKHLLNGTLITRLPAVLWNSVSRIDRALETSAPGLAWDVFVLAERDSGAS